MSSTHKFVYAVPYCGKMSWTYLSIPAHVNKTRSGLNRVNEKEEPREAGSYREK